MTFEDPLVDPLVAGIKAMRMAAAMGLEVLPSGHNAAMKAATKRLDTYLAYGRHLNGSRGARERGRIAQHRRRS